MKSNEYKCALCKEVFNKGWSDEEAQAEALEVFGEIPQDQQEVVCDDCYKMMITAVPPINPKDTGDE